MLRYISALSNGSSRLDVLSGIVFLSLSDMSLDCGSVFDLFPFHFHSIVCGDFSFCANLDFSFFLFLTFVACFVLSMFAKFLSLEL